MPYPRTSVTTHKHTNKREKRNIEMNQKSNGHSFFAYPLLQESYGLVQVSHRRSFMQSGPLQVRVLVLIR